MIYFLLLFLPCVGFSQSSDKNPTFEGRIKELNMRFSMPQGFTVLDTPKTYMVRDTSEWFRMMYNGWRKVNVWNRRLRCKGRGMGVYLLRITNKEKNLIISYYILKFPEKRYDAQLSSDFKRNAFSEDLLQSKFNADDGRTYSQKCDGVWNNFNNYRVLYLAKRSSGCEGCQTYASFVKLVYQYQDSLKNIDQVMEETSKTIGYLE